jgi:plasmid stabilization system protein ParE
MGYACSWRVIVLSINGCWSKSFLHTTRSRPIRRVQCPWKKFVKGSRYFPHRGTRRGDIRPGLRLTNYKGNAIVAFSVDDVSRTVAILGVYYGGQDYESALKSDST